MKRGVGAFFLAGMLFFPGTLPARKPDAISSRREDLKKIQDELERKKRERRDAIRRARELEEEVSRISGEWKSSRKALKTVEDRLRRAERDRAEAEDRLWAARLDVGQWNAILSKEMRVLYERRAAAEGGRFMELARRRALLKDKAAAAGAARSLHTELKDSYDDLAESQRELQALRRRRGEESDRVREAKTRMTGVLATVQGRKALLENDIAELKAAARRFEKLITDLIKDQQQREARARAPGKTAAPARKPSKPAVSREMKALLAARGKLPWPVKGALSERFGKFKHPELDTFVFSNGIKIRPPAPSPVRAVEKGEVLYAGEFMGYGLMALVAHPENLFTIYAHLGRLEAKKGDKVSLGQSLGQSGTEGDVYFELRLHGEAMDPLMWLQ